MFHCFPRAGFVLRFGALVFLDWGAVTRRTLASDAWSTPPSRPIVAGTWVCLTLRTPAPGFKREPLFFFWGAGDPKKTDPPGLTQGVPHLRVLRADENTSYG